ncbi:MAG: NAD(P)H-dependent oxidoreductase subunit E [Desulfobacterales bacterium]|nr:NAD(P)H-dependent oxidoreductase subunit E [Desulfobacterales bacterium]
MKRSFAELARESRGSSEAVIPRLQAAQTEFGFISRDTISGIAEATGEPEAQIYGVASFYSQFSFTPSGKHIIRVCTGTACHVAGAGRIVEALSIELGVAPGGTTEDMLFTLHTVACLGCCSLSPVMMIDGETLENSPPPEPSRFSGEFAAGGPR